MATKLTRRIKRQLMTRPLVIELLPGDIITFRGTGKKTSHAIHLGQCAILASIINLDSAYQEKLKRYKEKKKAGEKCKRPKPPSRYYSDFYYKALK